MSEAKKLDLLGGNPPTSSLPAARPVLLRLGWGCLGLLGVGANAASPHFTTLDKLGSSVWIAWLAPASMQIKHERSEIAERSG